MKEAGLPEPEYKEELGGFSVYFYKDIYPEENLRKMGLNERQIKAVIYVKEKGKVTNREYQELCNTSERTATRDLTGLVNRGIFEQVGITGKGTNYTLKTPQRRQIIRKTALIPILTDEEFSLNQAAPRHKKNCPDIGHWLQILIVTTYSTRR